MTPGPRMPGRGFLCCIAFLIVLVLLSGCLAPIPPGGAALSASTRRQIYERSNTEFARAAFIKPEESGLTNQPSFKFAPLFMQQRGRQTTAGQRANNEVASEKGMEISKEPRFTVFFRHDRVFIYDLPHDQFTYVWYPSEELSAGANHALPVQGIRITLDSAGEPVIWEVLADTSGAELIFVAQSLESAAAGVYGRTLPDRRFSVERSLDEAPQTVVARVIDDGPVPMGPIVYLSSGSGNVSTVMCRCMAPQTERLVAEGYYALRHMDSLATKNIQNSNEQFMIHSSFPLEPNLEPCRLEQRLRLPRNF